MAVTAPFRFARIWKKVHIPAWGELVTHDIPFSDGVCGEATVTVIARTPIVVGGARRAASPTSPGEVRPFQLPDGTWAIPGSALQGLCRSVLEIASFGRLGGWVDDKRFAYRDLGTSETAKKHYGRRLSSRSAGELVTQHSQAGWLIKTDEGPRIIPCKMARIHVNDVIAWKIATLRPGASIPDRDSLTLKRDAKKRMDWFSVGNARFTALENKFSLQAPPPDGWSHQNGRIRIAYDRAKPSAAGVSGTLVLTGKPQNGLGAKQKKFDFVFYSPNRPDALTLASTSLQIADVIWDAFELSHFKFPGRDENPNWTVWKNEFDAKRPVPVFYWVEGGKVSTFGTAFAFKAAFENSTHDLLRNSNPDHTPPEVTSLDLPHLIFGAAADDKAKFGLKRRAAFGLARGSSTTRTTSLGNPLNLLGPKPSYFPIYVRQRADNAGLQAAREAHATYSPLAGAPRHLSAPELAGVKIWPAAINDTDAKTHNYAKPPIGTMAVQTQLNVLPVGTSFETKLTFHNLRPAELGAVLWALSIGDPLAFGDDPAAVTRRHRLGMGKSAGLGAVSFHVALNVDDDHRTGQDFVETFETYMGGPTAIGPKWQTSKQIKALRKATSVAENAAETLAYMALGNVNTMNTYVGERNGGGYLPDYVTGDEPLALPVAAPVSAIPIAAGLDLVVGARVRLTNGGQEGIVLSIKNEVNPRCVIRIPKRPDTTYRAGAFTVIAPPAD